MTELVCPSPDCDRDIYVDKSRDLIPSLWNSCCSPECGQFVAGIMYSHSDPDVHAQMKFNANALLRCEEWIRARIDSCDEHEWEIDPRRFVRVFPPGSRESVTRDALKCSACGAKKTGDPR